MKFEMYMTVRKILIKIEIKRVNTTKRIILDYENKNIVSGKASKIKNSRKL